MKFEVRNNGAVVSIRLIDNDALDVAIRLSVEEALTLSTALDNAITSRKTSTVEVKE